MAETNNIENLIQNLLFDNDCVIVPGFGGFVTVYQPAKILSKQGVMIPPSREIGFNKKLINNDGLLANQLSIDYNLSFENALKVIQERVAFYNSELNRIKRLEISGVGVLYVDKDGNYRFMPNEQKNFLKKSFGLSKIYLDKVGVTPIEVTETIEPKIIPLVPEEKTAEKVFPWAKIAAAVAVPLFLFGGYWLAGKMDGDNTSFASFNPFGNEKEIRVSDYKSDNYNRSWGKQKNYDTAGFESLMKNNSERNTVNYSFEDEKIAENGTLIKTVQPDENALIKENKVVDPVTLTNNEVPEVKTETVVTYNFYIVGGAFQDRTNADKLVNKLKTKGFNAHIFGKMNGMNYVCFEGFETKADAKLALDKIKQITPSAWIKSK